MRAFSGGRRDEADLANVFAAFSSFSMLNQPLNSLAYLVADCQAASQAADRLGAFFLAEEQTEEPLATAPDDDEGKLAIELRTASFAWIADDDAPAPFQLRDLSLRVQRGELLAIVGPVASGKSSLCRALLGEMRRLSGEATCCACDRAGSELTRRRRSVLVRIADRRRLVGLGPRERERVRS